MIGFSFCRCKFLKLIHSEVFLLTLNFLTPTYYRSLKFIWINYHFVFFKPIYCCFTLLSVEETRCNNFDLQKFINPYKFDFVRQFHVTIIVIAT